MYSTNKKRGTAAFWFAFEGNGFCLKVVTPRRPVTSLHLHTQSHTESLWLVAPVVALKHVLRPPSDHVSPTDAGASGEVGIRRYEGN